MNKLDIDYEEFTNGRTGQSWKLSEQGLVICESASDDLILKKITLDRYKLIKLCAHLKLWEEEYNSL